ATRARSRTTNRPLHLSQQTEPVRQLPEDQELVGDSVVRVAGEMLAPLRIRQHACHPLTYAGGVSRIVDQLAVDARADLLADPVCARTEHGCVLPHGFGDR